MKTSSGNGNSPVVLEQLEQRSLLSGVTLITHGFGSNVSTWCTDMLNGIRSKYLDTNVPVYKLTVSDPSHAGGQLSVDRSKISGLTLQNAPNAEIFILLDWSDVAGAIRSDGAITGYKRSTVDVAAAVAEVFQNNEFVFSGHSFAELPIHLIGHSRGGSLIDELARDLGQRGIWVDQVTTLDPHPYQAGYPLCEDAYTGAYTNVVFADNYYQMSYSVLGSPLYGDRISGAINKGPMSLPGGAAYSEGGEHNNVHSWYTGTIGGSVGSPLTQEGALAIPGSWYSGTERTTTGFNYSRIAGGGTNWNLQGVSSAFDLYGTGFGQGARSSITGRDTATNSQWPNVMLTSLGSATVQEGQEETLTFYAQDYDSSFTVYYGVDNDQNPYNNASFPSNHLMQDALSAPQKYCVHWLPTISDNHGYIYAAVTDGAHTRYFYLPQQLTVTAAPPPSSDQVSVQFLGPLTSADPTVTIRGTASSTVTQVTWANLTTGTDGVAYGTSSWDAKIDLAAGSNQVRVTVTDGTGHYAYAVQHITYDLTSKSTDIYADQIGYVTTNSPRYVHSDTYLRTGCYGGQDSNYRGLVSFDLSSIPAGSTINSASLKAKVKYAYGSGSFSFTPFIELSSWKPNNSGANVCSGAGDSATSVPINVPASVDADIEADISQCVKDWYDGSLSNNGLMFVSSVENTSGDHERYFRGVRITVNYTPEGTIPVIGISPYSPTVYQSQVMLNGDAWDTYGIAVVKWYNNSTGASGTAQVSSLPE